MLCPFWIKAGKLPARHLQFLVPHGTHLPKKNPNFAHYDHALVIVCAECASIIALLQPHPVQVHQIFIFAFCSSNLPSSPFNRKQNKLVSSFLLSKLLKRCLLSTLFILLCPFAPSPKALLRVPLGLSAWFALLFSSPHPSWHTELCLFVDIHMFKCSTLPSRLSGNYKQKSWVGFAPPPFFFSFFSFSCRSYFGDVECGNS